MSSRAVRRSRLIPFSPDASSAALLVIGVATSLGAASLGSRVRGTADDAMLSAYERASWQISAEGGGLSSVLYLGHLLGPMFMLASLVHARTRYREQLEASEGLEEGDGVDATASADAPRTLRRISFLVPRSEALTLAETLRTAPSSAHDAVGPLARAIERAGLLEHVDLVIDAVSDEVAIERERVALSHRLVTAGLGGAVAGYRDAEAVPPALAGEHAIVSWVLVTRSGLDPLLDVPARGETALWLASLVPLRPEETLAVDAFVTPRTAGVHADALSRALSLEPLRGKARNLEKAS
jgi:hypothetical protein